MRIDGLLGTFVALALLLSVVEGEQHMPQCAVSSLIYCLSKSLTVLDRLPQIKPHIAHRVRTQQHNLHLYR
jgi:hypothetical protein